MSCKKGPTSKPVGWSSWGKTLPTN